MNATFEKSKGNAGLHGVQFQVSLTTLALLNAFRNLEVWRISTENKAAGKFDDIVLELSDGCAVLLQAKHKDSKRITRDALFSDNSKNADFSLLNSFFSYEEINDKFAVESLIVCTNAILDVLKLKDIAVVQQAGSENILHHGGGSCSFIKFNENILSELKIKAASYCKNNLKGNCIDEISDENLKEFLNKLQFFIGYPSGEALNDIIGRLLFRLRNTKLASDVSFQEMYRKVEDWFKQEKGEYLTKDRAKAIFCEIRSDKYCKMLENCNVSFQRNDLNFTETERVFHITTCQGHLLPLLKIHSVLERRKTLYVNPDEDLEVQQHAIEAFEIPKYAYLVLICINIKHLNMFAKLKTTLDKQKYKKVILIAANKKQPFFPEEYVVYDDVTVTFSDLTRKTRERLMRTENINFQGEHTSLYKLIEAKSLEDCTKAVDSETLEKLVKGETLRVGTPPVGVDEDTSRYYVNRTFERETTKEVISIPTEESVLTPEEGGLNETTLHQVSVDPTAIEAIKSLIKDNTFRTEKLLLNVDEDTSKYCTFSSADRIDLNKRIETILPEDVAKAENSAPHDVKGNTLKILKVKQILTEEIVFGTKEKVILISDSAGMGKSTVLAKLSVGIKEANSDKWIIRIDLKNYIKFFRDRLKREVETFKITELLESKEATRLKNGLEHFVFRMEKKVVILIDGFDEISPDYTKLVLDLLVQCRAAPNFVKVIITTRPHMSKELQTAMEVDPYVLQPFTKEDQIDYLTSFWMHTLDLDHTSRGKCEKYSAALIDKMSSLINGDDFASIPLQLRMLAEIFDENVTLSNYKNWKGCKEFLNGD